MSAWTDAAEATMGDNLSERVLIGGLLLVSYALHIIALERVLTPEEAAGLLVSAGPLGEFHVLSLPIGMIALYIVRPVALLTHYINERRTRAAAGEVDG